jgi:hypothetical protein
MIRTNDSINNSSYDSANGRLWRTKRLKRGRLVMRNISTRKFLRALDLVPMSRAYISCWSIYTLGEESSLLR